MKTESVGADILLEAHLLVTGARQDSYGNVTEDYGKVIAIFEGLTGIKLSLADALLFGTFFLWAAPDYTAARRRDRAAATAYTAGSWARDALATGAGLALWLAFTFWLHRALIGVAPLG